MQRPSSFSMHHLIALVYALLVILLFGSKDQVIPVDSDDFQDYAFAVQAAGQDDGILQQPLSLPEFNGGGTAGLKATSRHSNQSSRLSVLANQITVLCLKRADGSFMAIKLRLQKAAWSTARNTGRLYDRS